MTKVLVELPQLGAIEGQILKTDSGFSYKSFTCVPYAKPPLEDLKFRDPVPVEPWQGVLDATKEMKECAQFDIFIKKTYLGEEDCLYLNVYVPESAKGSDKLPVMFWVHGGGYNCGSGKSDVYAPDFLVPHNVILVTINYRVGALGFLYLDIEEAPGNMGLKDQAMALSWVNKYIKYFGGDPDNVTIVGESAGGSSVHNLLLGKPSQGKFKRAIIQSGVSYCEWALPEDPQKATFALAELLGIHTKDKKELVEMLRKIPVEKLVMSSFEPIMNGNIHIPFGPVVEKEIPNVSPFYTEDPRKTVEKGNIQNIPIMIGCTSNEGFLMVYVFIERLGFDKKDSFEVSDLVPDFKSFVPLHLQRKFDEKKMEIAAQKIKDFYFPVDGSDVVKQYEVLQSDYCFIKDIDFTIKKYAKHCPTYFYRFDYKGNMNIFHHLSPLPYEKACHADELGYLFKVSTELLKKKVEVTEKDIMTVKRMTQLWTNFAKYGDPTPAVTDLVPVKWQPVSGDDMTCLEIGDSVRIIQNPYKERVKFWEDLENI